ncbi:pyridoxal phosphate-dependent transferase [Calycina marina]|uniref:phosphoserine transaminase n=1 Tax=Calycina marina TaxID=1763456 RepID=A0A9P8CCW9_9HELO|nr:pyridoxal phosphate-dependent transferase [Calycina marina]
MSRESITYFGAGPAGLPTTVLETVAAALVNYKSLGLGIAEISHRSKDAEEILNSCKKDLRTYLGVPDEFEVLFMQGGGTGQFSATIYEFVSLWVERRRKAIAEKKKDEEEVQRELEKEVEELKIDYLVTGGWSLKASQEAARLVGDEHVNIVTDARKINGGKFGKIPEEEDWKISKNAAMVYYCDNETVDGVEFPTFPAILKNGGGEDEPLVVADMSSNILSRPIPFEQFSAVFFGAQKNLGCAGLTVVIIKRCLLAPTAGRADPKIMRKLGLPIGPIALSYDIVSKNNSLYNTLSITDVFLAGQVLKKALNTFGEERVGGQMKVSGEKAEKIYGVLDKRSERYSVVANKGARSRMNICFRILDDEGKVSEELEAKFVKDAAAEGLTGLKGHRSVGGIRASNYNSVSFEGATKLAEFLEQF